MKISFCGCIPPYKTQKAEIYPIEKDITPSEINAVCSNIIKRPEYLGEGVNGCAYALGRDLVVKKSKQNALVNSNIMNEARKLDMLYDLCQESKVDLGNTQKGIAGFQLNNGESYLISTFVKGQEADFYTNPLNIKNLESLISILTVLDKGSEKHGRLMVNDLNLHNIHFTKDKAGVLDFEHMKGYKLDESIKKVIIEKNYGIDVHTSDTSYLYSNIRSFEFAGLYYYLQDMPQNETGELFKKYLKLKSTYHKQMAEYYAAKADTSAYSDIAAAVSKSEKAHFNILKSENIPDDIIKSEAMKIQMSNFIFVSSKWCNASFIKFNPRQILDYHKNGLSYFEKMKQNAVNENDEDRIIYYEDCINLFKKWNKIKSLPMNMDKTQKCRITTDSVRTLDNII